MHIDNCTAKGCKNPAVRGYLKCTFHKHEWEMKRELFEKDFVLNVADINVTSQGDKIVIAKRNGNAYSIILEMDIEQALAVGIAIRSVATCAKYSKG